MHISNTKGRTKALAIAVAVTAILAVSVRNTAPGRQPDSLPAPPHLDDVALFEEIQAWLDPASGTTTALASLGSRPMFEAIRSHEESFTLFIGAADADAVRDRMQQVPFGTQIVAVAERHEIDPLLVAAVVQTESAFDRLAVSPQGALGLMQMMPKTAEEFGVANVYDPGQNLDAGASYLASLLRRFDGDLVLALAAYNAGPGKVERMGGMPPFRETRKFTENVLRLYVEHHRAAWAAVNPRGLDFAVLAGG
ncbi:MAG: lytic transglycosylase domain-containing protein [Acidobacteria bacterium]|nr:lytic transglycosylase domain-containing protein [Acidobacteriota bacterium]